MSKLNLPEPIAAYFDADKRDGEAVARCFTNQGALLRGAARRPVHRDKPAHRQFPW
jgi:hypothetical protein